LNGFAAGENAAAWLGALATLTPGSVDGIGGAAGSEPLETALNVLWERLPNSPKGSMGFSGFGTPGKLSGLVSPEGNSDDGVS